MGGRGFTRRLLGAFLAVSALAGGARAGEPLRVVSVNLCTDQLAMLVAAPGQLISVSWLARDPRSSAMVEEAMAFPVNHGRAEEIFLLKPDLVLAGTYTTRATVDLLRRLGIRVVEFGPANSLRDIPERLARMGEVLGRPRAAAGLIARFRDDLATLRHAEGPRPRVATWHANGYTTGRNTLADSVIEAAGLVNIAAELGREGGGQLPLESLVMAMPDLVITGEPPKTPSLAEETFGHPALDALKTPVGRTPVADRDWVCGTPRILNAIRGLVAARAAMLSK